MPLYIPPSLGGVSDGDKGDITVSGSGATWTIDNSTVTEAKVSLSDNTTNDVSTSAHGFVPKAPNNTTSFLRGDATWATPPGSNPDWYGNIIAAYGRGDPQQLMRMAQSGSVAATPTNISTTVARIAYFRPAADITVNKIRFFGVGATTNVYRVAIYNGDTLARIMAETAFSTSSQAWGSIGSSLNLSLVKDQLYFIAVSVNATGTTAGCLCIGGSPGATTGRVGVSPKSWPGNLDIDSGYMDGAYAQGTVTLGALPDPFPTVAAQASWTGGFPLFFLDNNNA